MNKHIRDTNTIILLAKLVCRCMPWYALIVHVMSLPFNRPYPSHSPPAGGGQLSRRSQRLPELLPSSPLRRHLPLQPKKTLIPILKVISFLI